MHTTLEILVHELTGIPYHVEYDRMLTESKRIFVENTPREVFLNSMKFIGILIFDKGLLINLSNVEKHKILVSLTAQYLTAKRASSVDLLNHSEMAPFYYLLVTLMLKAGAHQIDQEYKDEIASVCSQDIMDIVNHSNEIELDEFDRLVTEHLLGIGFDFS